MATSDDTTTVEPAAFSIPYDRADVIREAAYELESLAIYFPRFFCDQDYDVTFEYAQRLFINRVKTLARTLMQVMDFDGETKYLREIVNLPEVGHEH